MTRPSPSPDLALVYSLASSAQPRGELLRTRPELAEAPLTRIRPGHWRNQWRVRHVFWNLFVLWDSADEHTGDEVLCHRKHESEVVAERVARREQRCLPWFARKSITYLGPRFFPDDGSAS